MKSTKRKKRPTKVEKKISDMFRILWSHEYVVYSFYEQIKNARTQFAGKKIEINSTHRGM